MQNEPYAEVHCPLCGGAMTSGQISTYGACRVIVSLPNKIFPNGSDVRLWVCLSCGYIMQFATNPERFRPQ